MDALVAARITAFSLGASPPPVAMPIQRMSGMGFGSALIIRCFRRGSNITNGCKVVWVLHSWRVGCARRADRAKFRGQFSEIPKIEKSNAPLLAKLREMGARRIRSGQAAYVPT